MSARGAPERGTPVRVVLEPMRPRDMPAVLDIEAAVYPRPWSPRVFADELAQRRSRVYRVARVGRTIVGYAGLMLVQDDAHVNNIAVAPEWQGRGIATVLLVELVRVAADRRACDLTLEVRVGNDRAIALYQRFGLAPVGVRPGYYEETGEDALIMWARGIGSEAYARRVDGIVLALPEDLSVRWGPTR